MPRTVLSGRQGELVIEHDVIPVHYLSDIDADWTFTDAAGHRHHCEYDAADRYPTLTQVPGSTLPSPYGGAPRQVMVDLDLHALQGYGLTPLDVTNAA